MNDLAIALFMKDKVGQVYDVKIAQVTEFGLFVKLAFGVSGLIHISSLKRVILNTQIYLTVL